MFIPSPEQQAIFDYVTEHQYKPGQKALAVSALAGTGKTSTIIELIQKTKAQGIYCAFNKDIVREVEPKLKGTGVQAKTFHSMGYGALIKELKRLGNDLDDGLQPDGNKYRNLAEELILAETGDISAALRQTITAAADVIFKDMEELEGMSLPPSERDKLIKAIRTKTTKVIAELCRLTMLKLVEWNDEDALESLEDDYQVSFDMLALEHMELLDTEEFENLYRVIIKSVKHVMAISEKRLKEEALLDFTDMIYWVVRWNLKIWKNKWVFVDEAQDLSPMQREMVAKALRNDGFIVIVGDHHQCVIEGTMIGDRKAEDIRIGDAVPAGYGKGEIKPAKVTRVYQRHIENAQVVTITTASGHQLTTTPEHMHFAEYTHIEHDDTKQFFVYLMYKKSHGYRIGVTRKYRTISAKKQSHQLGYKIRSNQESADKMWLLRSCETEAESRYYEALYSARYELPTITFKHVPGSPKTAGMALTQDLIDSLYSELDTTSAASKLLDDLNFAAEYPHHIPKCVTLDRRRNFSIIMCSDNRASQYTLHRCEISGNDMADAEALIAHGIMATDNGKGTGWRYRKYSKDLGELYDIYAKVNTIVPCNLIQKANLSAGRSISFMPAKNILKGMTVFVEQNGKLVHDKVISVETRDYSGYVYDFDIEHIHNFIANGIATHNSIYRFAGSDADSFDLTVAKFNAHVLPLTVTRRCDRIIAEHASRIVPSFIALPEKGRGNVVYLDEKQYELIEPQDMVICRTKAPLVSMALKLIAAGKSAVVLGIDIEGYIFSLAEGLAEEHGDKFNYGDLPLLIEQKKEEIETKREKLGPIAADMQLDNYDALATIVDAAPVESLDGLQSYIKKTFSTADDGNAIICCTGHKSKGLEADRVWILKPEKMPLRYPMMHPESALQEFNLQYVAESRARHTLVYLTNDAFYKRIEMDEGGFIPDYVQYDLNTDMPDEQPVVAATEPEVTLPPNPVKNDLQEIEAAHKVQPEAAPTNPIEWAKWAIEQGENALVLDTETTNIINFKDASEPVEIVQLSIVDMTGQTRFSHYILPTKCQMDEGAAEVHGITMDALINKHDALPIKSYATQLKNLLTGKHIIAYNVNFDREALVRTFALHGLTMPDVAGWHCAMLTYVKHNPNKTTPWGKKGGWWKLVEAMEQEGLEPDENAHDALADVLMTIDLIKAMAGEKPKSTQPIGAVFSPYQAGDKVRIKTTGVVMEVVDIMSNGDLNLKDPDDEFSRQTMSPSNVEMLLDTTQELAEKVKAEHGLPQPTEDLMRFNNAMIQAQTPDSPTGENSPYTRISKLFDALTLQQAEILRDLLEEVISEKKAEVA